MLRLFPLIVITFSLFPALISGDSGRLEGLSDEDVRRLERGETVILVKPDGGAPGRTIHAAFLVGQPIDRCWEMLRLPERQHEFTSRLSESRLVSESADSKVVRFLLKVLLIKVRYQVKHLFHDELYRVDISLDPAYENDLTIFDGTWLLYPVEKGITLARYSSVFRLSPLIPSFIQSFLARQSIPQAMEAWRLWIDSGGTWRKKE